MSRVVSFKIHTNFQYNSVQFSFFSLFIIIYWITLAWLSKSENYVKLGYFNKKKLLSGKVHHRDSNNI